MRSGIRQPILFRERMAQTRLRSRRFRIDCERGGVRRFGLIELAGFRESLSPGSNCGRNSLGF